MAQPNTASQKQVAQRIHAKKRAAQRYGLVLNRGQLRQIVQLIQEERGVFLERQSLRVTLWQIEWEGRLCKVVYDSQRKNVVSFLPLGAKPEAPAP